MDSKRRTIGEMVRAALLPATLAGLAIGGALRLAGREDLASATMTRAHLEIAHLSRLFVRQLDAIASDGPSSEDLRDLRRILYGLYAVLRLHFAQEEEAYLSYVEERLGTHERATSAA